MENDLVNYPLRIERTVYKQLKDYAYNNDLDIRTILLKLIDEFLKSHGNKKPEAKDIETKAEREFNELVKSFFTHGNKGQKQLFMMALEHHKKNIKKGIED